MGMNSVVNGQMEKGIFRLGKIGEHAEISKGTLVVKYANIKSGFFVAGDNVILSTKKYKQ